jgi:hypothetical protein
MRRAPKAMLAEVRPAVKKRGDYVLIISQFSAPALNIKT